MHLHGVYLLVWRASEHESVLSYCNSYQVLAIYDILTSAILSRSTDNAYEIKCSA
jgi:hypothetical protein